MAKTKSRSARWSEAVSEARVAFDNLNDALGTLKEIQEEYQEWMDNLPENLQSSALGEKLTAVTELDLDCASDVETVLDEAEGIELPMGFGRD